MTACETGAMQPYGREPAEPGSDPAPHPVAAPEPPYGYPAYPAYPEWTGPQSRPGVRLVPTRREVAVAAAVVAGLAALGVLVGLLWAVLSPRLEFRVVRPDYALPVLPEAEEYIAADGRFALLTLGAGALAGLVCWWSRRTRGPLLVLALAVGGLVGAIVAWRLGPVFAPGYQPADLRVVGNLVRQPLQLGAEAALVVEPIAAVVVYLLAAGFASRNDLGRGDDPGLSSGSG
jgi:hypothetical protein